jgi:hypothetical protein
MESWLQWLVRTRVFTFLMLEAANRWPDLKQVLQLIHFATKVITYMLDRATVREIIISSPPHPLTPASPVSLGSITAIDLKERKVVSTIKREKSPIMQLVTFDDKRIAVAHNDGALYIWDTTANKSVLDMEVPDTDSLLSMCKAGTVLYVGSRQGICRGYKLDHLLH